MRRFLLASVISLMVGWIAVSCAGNRPDASTPASPAPTSTTPRLPPPTMGGGTLPVDALPVPTGERVTWGDEPLMPVSRTRTEVVLNGLWQFVPNVGQKPAPPEGGWGWMRVPGSWRTGGWPGVFWGLVAPGTTDAWKDFDRGEAVYAGWYQRPIRIPADWAGRRVLLDCERVSTDATVYLDGQAVGSIVWPSGRVDLTAAIKPGTEQTLRILVLASAGAKEFAQFMGTATEQVTKSKAEVRARGLIGDVTLLALPTGPEISDIFAKPTVEGGTRLDLEVTLDGATVAEDATLEATLFDAEQAVVGTFTSPVRITASSSQVLTAGWPVGPVKLWDFGQPNLYHVEVALRGSSVTDTHRVRFGFRQFRVDGRRFLLNGSEIRLRPNLSGIQTNGALVFPQETREHIAERRHQGYNLTELWPGSIQRRGTEDYQSVPARIADEEGWFITGILPHLGDFISAKGIDQDGVKAAARTYRRLRNHPSILMWGCSGNYFGHKTDQDPRNIGRRGFADADAEYRKRADIGNQGLAIYRAMDPTRPLFTHHGGDVGDLHTCNNYLNLLPMQEREEWLSTWSQNGTMPYWPVEFETPISLSLMRDRNGHVSADTSEPFLSEYCAGVFGERVYSVEPAEYRSQMISGYEGKDRWRFRSVRMGTAPAFQELQVLNQRALWRSWRALGSTIMPLPWDDAYTHRGGERVEVPAKPFAVGERGPWTIKRRADRFEELPAARALGAYDPEGAGGPTLAYICHAPGDDPAEQVAKDHHVVAGGTVRKAILLINDERQAIPWHAQWTATIAGKTVASDSASGKLAIAARTSVPISIALPRDTQRGEMTIELTARMGEREHRDRFIVQLYPTAAPATGSVLVVDPVGDSTRALQALGFSTTSWDGAAAPGAVVVVGRHALSDEKARSLDYARHVAAGGRLVVLTQERAWYEQDQNLRTAAWSSRRVFSVPSMVDHPIITGLTEADLRDWNGAGTSVAARPAPVYEKESHNYPRYGWKWGNRGTVAGLSIEKPHHGGWRPLLQCEFDLAYSPLMELPDGQGLTIWCTLDLEARTIADPVADRLLARIVEHAISFAGETPRREAVLLGRCDRLASLGLLGSAGDALPGDHRTVVIGADSTIDDETLRTWISAGGRALVLMDAQSQRLGFSSSVKAKHLGSLVPPAWPEARGLGASDLRLRNQADMPVLTGAPSGGEIAADGLLGRLSIGSGVAILTTIDPAMLPADEKPWLRFSRWRWTRSLAQLAGNLGIRARTDGKAVLADLRRDAPRPLAGTWRMQVEQALAPTTIEKPHPPIAMTDASLATVDDSTWMTIPVPGNWEATPPQFDGAVWIRKTVDIPKEWAGKALVVELGPIDDHDTVWFDGHRIGGIGSDNPDAWRTPRIYSIPAEFVRAGPAVVAIRAFDWFGGGGFSTEPDAMRLLRADGSDSPLRIDGIWQGRIETAYPLAKSPGALVDPGIAAHATTWHQPETDDRTWQPIRLPQSFEGAFAEIDGVVWLRTTVEVPTHWAGRDLDLHLGPIADQDVVFVAGQEIGRGSGSGSRRYRIPAALVKAGPLPIAIRVFNQAGPGGIVGLTDDLFLALPDDIAGAPWFERGYRTDFSTGDDPFRYYRW